LKSEDDLFLVGQHLLRYIFLPGFLNKKRRQLQQLFFRNFMSLRPKMIMNQNVDME
jgi:hypothetical protein